MKTQAQVRAEIYNALKNDSVLPDAIYWEGQATPSVFPCLVYTMIGLNVEYVFNNGNVGRNAVNQAVQIDIYVDTGEVASLDTYKEQLYTVMGAINYQCIDAGPEFYDTDISKVLCATRWTRYNV